MELEPQMIEFMKGKKKEIDSFLGAMYDVKIDMKRKIDSLRQKIEGDDIICGLKKDSDFNVWAWQRWWTILTCVGVDLKYNGGVYVAEIGLDYEWRMWIWDRNKADIRGGNEIIENIKKIGKGASKNIKQIGDGAMLEKRDEAIYPGRVLVWSHDANGDCTDEMMEKMRTSVEIITKLAKNQN